QTLQNCVQFVLDMVERYGAAPRPYVAKDMVPGNTGWLQAENAARIETLLQHPEYFQSLEYAALPTSISHPNAESRVHIEKTFHMLLGIPGNTTQLVYPISPDIDEKTTQLHQRLNQGKFDR